MYQIVIGVISIALLALLMAAGINYLHPDRVPTIALSEEMAAEYQSLRAGYQAYLVDQRRHPDPAEWRSQMAGYVQPAMPAGRHGLEWSLGRTAGGAPFLCLAHEGISDLQLAAASRMTKQASAAGHLLSQACDDDEDEPAAGEPFALTFYITAP